MNHRANLDKLVDWRKANRAWDTSPVKVNLGPKELNDALRLPKPKLGDKYPVKVTYRGIQLLAKEQT